MNRVKTCTLLDVRGRSFSSDSFCSSERRQGLPGLSLSCMRSKPLTATRCSQPYTVLFGIPTALAMALNVSALFSELDCLQDVLDLVARIFCLQGFNLRHTDIREKRISSFYFVRRGRCRQIMQSIPAVHVSPALLSCRMQLVAINLQEEKNSRLILSVIRVSISCVCLFICCDLQRHHAMVLKNDISYS